MLADNPTHRFIRSAFGSLWSLELLNALRTFPDRAWRDAELIARLHASEQVLARSTADLTTAGLAITEGNMLRYAPATPLLDETAQAVVELYKTRPHMVRRLVLGIGHDPATDFAAAFRMRRP